MATAKIRFYRATAMNENKKAKLTWNKCYETYQEPFKIHYINARKDSTPIPATYKNDEEWTKIYIDEKDLNDFVKFFLKFTKRIEDVNWLYKITIKTTEGKRIFGYFINDTFIDTYHSKEFSDLLKIIPIKTLQKDKKNTYEEIWKSLVIALMDLGE